MPSWGTEFTHGMDVYDNEAKYKVSQIRLEDRKTNLAWENT